MKYSKAASAKEFPVKTKVTMQKAASLFLFRSAVIRRGQDQVNISGTVSFVLFLSPLHEISFPTMKFRWSLFLLFYLDGCSLPVVMQF